MSSSFSYSTPLSLRRNFSWTFGGNILYAASQWGFLIVLAKALTAEAVGQFAFALAVTAPIIIFANQGLTGLQATDAKNNFQFGEYFVCRLFTTSAALVLIGALTFLLHWSALVLVVGAAKAAEALCDIKYGQYQKLDRMDKTAQSMVLRGVCSLIIALVLVSVWRSVIAATFGLVIGNIAILLAKDYRNYLVGFERDRIRSFSALKQSLRRGANVKCLLWQALPLGVAAMLGSATSSIPRYFVEHYNGAAMLGIFAALMYLLVAGRMVVVAVAQACVASLARLYIRGLRAQFYRLMFKQIAIALALGALGIVISLIAGKMILTLLYRPEYAAYSQVLVLVMAAAALNYAAEFVNGGLLAARIITVQPAILGVCCVAILIASDLLVPRFGITGAAWAVVIAGVIQLCTSVFFLARASFVNAEEAALV